MKTRTATPEARQELAQAVVSEMHRIGDAATSSALWPRVLEFIHADPMPYARALGLLPEQQRQQRAIH